MKKILSIVLTIIALYTSCSLLDENNPVEVDVAEMYKTVQDAELAIKGCYSKIPVGNYNYDMFLGIQEDICIIEWKNQRQYQLGVFNAQDYQFLYMWEGFYSLIYNANTILERVPQIVVTEEEQPKIARILGEAKFFRAWSYLQLVSLWGPVPLVTSSIPSADYSAPRASIDDIYNQIATDLESAIATLDESYTGADFGRVTKNAARATLANAYLTRAGNDENSEYWVSARDYAKQCIDHLGGLDHTEDILCPNYRDLWLPKNKLHQEYILTRERIASPGLGSQMANQYAATPDYTGSPAYGPRHLAPVFYESFEPRCGNPEIAVKDERLKGGVHRTFVLTMNGGVTKYFWPGDSKGNAEKGKNIYKNFWGEEPPEDAINPSKFVNKARMLKYDDMETTMKDASGANIPIIRYPEVLLIFAEAENEINGPSADAQKAVNAVRARAKLGPTDKITDKATFREQILLERKWEFYGEFKRIFDLFRRDRFVETMNDFITKVYGAGMATRTDAHRLFPIPSSEILSNKALNAEDQNPGW